MSQLNERELDIALTGLKALQQLEWEERKRLIEKFDITMPFISDIESVIKKLEVIASAPNKITSDLVDVQSGNSDNPITASIEVGEIDGMLELRAKGYSDHHSADGFGVPILIENSDNALQLRVWADINSQDPTHVISLSGAKTANRQEVDGLDLNVLNTKFILEIFDAPNNLTADQIKLEHPDVKSWQFVGYREELDERYAAVEFDTKTPVTALSLGGDVAVSITDFEIQGANVYIANRK